MSDRFEEEIGQLREAIETETTRRREDMKELTAALNQLQNAISLQHTGPQGPRGPEGPQGPRAALVHPLSPFPLSPPWSSASYSRQ